jgi:eukaryotic-like serine/threonine-protein kinase
MVAMLTINARYQVKSQPIGQGGMGVVYRAYDVMTKRDVALKTMRDSLNQEALELFSKEWMVLARVSHPNIVDILDTGDFEHDGKRKPFFVMPLLPGVTLEQLIDNSSSRLTTERVVGIIVQACRGLHAAHERGLIHRDIKPSNIFVMDDDTVKIIDFGVVHLTGADSVTGLKGTLQYMAPENIEMKGTSAATDTFALGVVCYQALTGRKPFARKTDTETAEAILRHIPPPVYELNPLVSQTVSRVIHKAMAKAPWHRFSTAREFGETLQKALNGQPIERFDREKIQPRIDRARKTQIEGDYQFASEILAELEAEGHIDPEISVLRIQLDQAIRQKSIRQLLDGARIRLEEDEFPLALLKIQQVLQIDPENADALGLRKQIEKQSSERQSETWFKLVEQHLHNYSFGQARQALKEILKLNASDSRARKMLADVDQREEEITRLHVEKEELYQSALDCYQHGEISSALSKLERVLELHSQSPASALPDRAAQYQSFYNQVRTERDAARSTYAEGRRHLTDKNFAKALEVCGEFLKKSPEDRMFQALKLEIEEQQRQEQSAYIADVARRVEGEADLDRRVSILKEAAERYPEEPHFQQVLRLVRERRDLVNGIVAKASQYEERSQFNEAIGQFDILRNIYSQYPGLEFETERLRRRRDERVREESKARLVDQIDRNLSTGNYARARDIVRAAVAEFPQDEELFGLEQVVQRESDRAAEADEWLQHGQKLCANRNFAEGLEGLRKAASLDARNAVILAALANALVDAARTVLDSDWRAAELLIEEALTIDGGHLLAKSLHGQVLDRKRQEAANNCFSQVRDMRAKGDVPGALAKVEEVLEQYPNETRLQQLRKTLQRLDEETLLLPPPIRRSDTPFPAVQSGQPAQLPVGAAAPSWAAAPLVENRPRVDSGPIVAAAQQLTPPAELPNSLIEPNNTSPQFETTLISRRASSSLPEKRPEPKVRFGKLAWGIFGTGLTLIALALTTAYLRTHQPPPPPPLPQDLLVDLQSNVSDVAYKVDGHPPSSHPLYLRLGAHTIEASSPGYKSETKSIALSSSSRKRYTLAFQLVPEPIRLKLESNLKSGKVSVDGGEPKDLEDGQFVEEGIALSTDHTLSLLQAGKESLAFSFRAEPGKVVTLSAPIKATGFDAVVISDLASSARVYSSATTWQGAFNDQQPQPIPTEGLGRNNLPENSEVTLDDGKAPRRLTIEQSNSPSLAVHLLAGDPQNANVQIQSNVAGAQLFVNGRKWTVFKAEKSWTVLWPGTNVLWAEKEGYQRSAEQRVEVKKGDILTNLQVFELKPIVLTASLVIEGATPLAEVVIDNAPVGTTSDGGSFKRNEISPGNHTLLLRRVDFENKQFSRTFTAGQEVHISGAEGQLTQYGALEFHVSPANATITYKRQEETQAHTIENGRTARTLAGRYTVTVSADNYQQRADTVVVEPGTTIPISWSLAPQPKPPGPAPAPPPPQEHYFEAQPAWTQGEGWWIHKGAGVAWMAVRQGAFGFDFLRQIGKGGFPFFKKKTLTVDWVIDEKDANNRIDYSFDFRNIDRRVVTDGKTNKQSKKLPPEAAGGESCPIQIEISQERIIIKDVRGNELDTYQRPDPSAPLGKFGFKGEVALKVIRK